MKNFQNALNNWQGNWITHKSVYLNKSKVKINYGELIEVTNNTANTKLKTQFTKYSKKSIFDEQILYNLKSIHKQNKLQITNYDYYYNTNYIKLSLPLQNSRLIYNEYIYFITTNLNISISFLKKTSNHKYLSTTFISYIKTK